MPENVTSQPNRARISRAVKTPTLPTAIACGVFLLSLIYAIVTARTLYADGALYLLKIMQAGTFVEFEWNRNNASYLFELPAVVAMKLGVVDRHWLTLLFGLGCFCAWPIAMWFCYRMARNRFWLVMLACAAGYLNAAFVAVGEHVVAHAFFWPALFALLFVRPLTRSAALYLLLSAAILARSYESMFFLGPPLALLALIRLLISREKPWQRLTLALATALLVLSACYGLGGLIYPANPANLGGFKQGLSDVLHRPPWTVQMTAFWLILMAALFLPPARRVLKSPLGVALMAVTIALWAAWPLLAPGKLNPGIQYESRFLNLLVPLALLPVAWLLSIFPRWLAERQPDLVRFSAAMLVAQSLWHLAATYQWAGFARTWQQALITRQGPIQLASIYHGQSADGPQALHFDWGWANPCLSLMLGPDHVQAIVLFTIPNTPGHWQPFDPLKPATLPDLQRYGLDYSLYLKSLPEQK